MKQIGTDVGGIRNGTMEGVTCATHLEDLQMIDVSNIICYLAIKI